MTVGRYRHWVAAFMAIAMAVTGAAAHYFHGAPSPLAPAPDLSNLLPTRFGVWSQITLGAAVLPTESELTETEVVSYHAYTDDLGRVATLVVAYGPPLGDGVRLHRPETCYRAQGFLIDSRQATALTLGDFSVSLVHLDTVSGARREAVSYWLRDGDRFVTAEAQRQLFAFRRGIASRADGALVRVSTTGAGDAAFALHRDFLRDFTSALSPQARGLLLGANAPMHSADQTAGTQTTMNQSDGDRPS